MPLTPLAKTQLSRAIPRLREISEAAEEEEEVVVVVVVVMAAVVAAQNSPADTNPQTNKLRWHSPPQSPLISPDHLRDGYIAPKESFSLAR